MGVKSFIKDYFGLKPVEVEIVFTTGLPQISILGLPDQVIQESAKRIQTALVSQGYQMPKAKHVLVNLWPREIRKTSLGVDLAIALGILAESGQKNFFEGREGMAVYGELTLSGQVRAPKDIEAVSREQGPVITGGPIRSYDFPVVIIEDLKSEGVISDSRSVSQNWLRPKPKHTSFLKPVAELMSVVSVGQHSLLLAGPPGSGKTVFAETMASLLPEPVPSVFQLSSNIARFFGEKLNWHPVVSPHHTTPTLSMLGGGVPPRPGLIVKAHGGVLILDELLEFDPKVQSALRETLELGRIQVVRGARIEEFPAQFLTIATTNLCKCGEFVPSRAHRCRCSAMQLRRYSEKLTGPFVDRMTLLQFTHEWSGVGQEQEEYINIIERVDRVRDFIKQTRNQIVSNEKLSLEDIIASVDQKKFISTFEVFRSQRRKLAFWRVARTYADLDLSETILEKHLLKSQKITLHNFHRLVTF